ncbi:MAG: amidohydrolase family protein [Gemmatimonadales bacterium]
MALRSRRPCRPDPSRAAGFASFAVLALLGGPAPMPAQAGAVPADSGTFVLYKWQNPVGQETYRADAGVAGRSYVDSFAFVDRGQAVRLRTTLGLAPDGRPLRFTIQGRTSRISRIDTDVELTGDSVRVRVDSQARVVAAVPDGFPIGGYAPLLLQQELLRHWEARGRPATIPTLPSGAARITARGIDTVPAAQGPVALRRYRVAGLKWGFETVWCDSAGRLIAASTNDAEFSRFEAIRSGYEAGLATFVARSARDASEALAELGAGAEPAGDFALVDVTLVDGLGGPPVPHATVVVRGDRIVAAGARVAVPRGMTRIDGRGKTVLPGLWDMHAHYEQVEWGPIYLASGITTVRDVGNEFDFIPGVRDAIAAGRGVGPRLLLAGLVDGPEGIGVDRVADSLDAARVVRRFHAAGFRQIKVYSSLSRDALRQVAQVAHGLGMTVTGHVPEGLTALDAIAAGMDQINHVGYVADVMRSAAPDGTPAPFDPGSAESRRTLEVLRAHGTVVDPTVALYELLLHPRARPVAAFEPGSTRLPTELQGPLAFPGVPPEQAAASERELAEMLRVILALHEAGVPIVAGSDQGIPGYTLHREVELYVAAGFTPMAAIQAATLVPAQVMGLDAESGSITPWKRADLLVVEGNPLEDIRALRRVYLTVAAGRRFRPAPLWESVGFRP